ncbi:stabilizer of axonemal microtubules 1-like [Calypte anna]|uniref:stabilizer of axonemal microtubules 1-like n=1 Tax=Calypte anna TaxID=9244 RepID=UPI0011C3822A|nr:stabilizer of axonemal microtubules 1-like [Calypte anna]
MSAESSVELPVIAPLKKCICQLCSCGCHHCPHLLTKPYDKSEKPCMLSEYRERYPLHPSTAPRDPIKPKDSCKAEDVPIEGLTTTKRDYPAHEVLPRKVKPPAEYVKSDKTMDLASTYKQDYNAHSISQVPPCLPPVRHLPTDKMDTRTTYKDDYVPRKEPRTEIIRPNNRFCPAEDKFEHKTVVQDDYVYRGPVTTESCKPLSVDEAKAPFKEMTSYKATYVPHPLGKRYAHKYEEYKASEVPFDGLTTHKVSYKGLAGQPAKPVIPCRTKLPDTPLSSSTEFREKYQAWPYIPVFTRKPDVYLPPSEKMDLHTTSQLHYKHLNGKPATICRPFDKLNKNTGPLSSSSITKEDYKSWLCKKQEPINPTPQLTLSDKPMDCLTTFQANYVPHPASVTKSCKPAWSGPQGAPLDATTTYATTYTPKGNVRCLASYKHPPGYVFETTDADGHRLYHAVSKSECMQSGD